MRKIKLMALLLATLMVVSAFAGCAGVKKEELDALDVRVQALEDLLNGQQKDLADIKDQIADLDNEEVLKAIESIKTDLEDKIKDVNDRVDDVDGKQDSVGTVISDEVKTAQQNALAKIEVQRATYTKNSYKYSEANFEKISEALGTATGAVNNATTVDGVNKALAAMDAELKKYLTYQDMAFKYYTDLLGNVNMDAEDLVNEALDFLKEVKAVYDENKEFVGTIDNGDPYEGMMAGYIVELLYLVEEGTSDNRDKYIDMYNAVFTLCELYTGGASYSNTLYYVNAKGKVDFVTLKSVKGYQKEAEDLVERIAQALGEELKYCGSNHVANPSHCGFAKVSTIYNDYEGYVEAAGFLGGPKLLDLVTNAADIVEAEETVKLLEEAAEEFDKYIRVSAKGTADVFYYYDQLTLAANNAALLLESSLVADTTTGLKARNNVWIADEYEKTDDALADWVAEFELSETNMREIIAWKKGTPGVAADYNYYGQDSTNANTSYVSNKLTNALLVEAYNNFKTTLAEDIIEVNNMPSVDVNMVKLYDEIEENYNKFFKLQSKPATLTTAKHPENLDIYIDGGSSAGLPNTDIAAKNMWVILRDSGIFEEYAEERLEVLFDRYLTGVADGVAAGAYKSPKAIELLDVFTFESDKRTLEFDKVTPGINQIYFEAKDTDNNITTPLVVTDNRANGEIYYFFDNEYVNLKAAYEAINDQIALLDETLVITNNLAYVQLEGKYVEIAAEGATVPGIYELTISGTTFNKAYTDPTTGATVPASPVDANGNAVTAYFPVETVYNKELIAPGVGLDGTAGTLDDNDTYYDNYMKDLNQLTNTMTIESFKYRYPDFVDLLDLAIFEADKAEKAELLNKLFAEGLALVADLDAIPYVRLDTYGFTNTVYLFDDVNENGKFDYVDVNKDGVYSTGDTTTENPTLITSVPYLVNLSNKDAVEALWDRLVAWRTQGGNHTLQKFANYVDVYGTSYADVYVMAGFENADQVKVKYAGNMIETLHKDIVELVALSTSFISATSAAKSVHSVNKFVATLGSSNGYYGNLYKNPDDWRNRYAWTSIEEKNFDGSRAYEGIYKGYKVDLSSNPQTFGSTTIDTTKDTHTACTPAVQVMTGGHNVDGTAKAPLAEKEDLLQYVVNRYNDFEAANVMYVGDPANDYVTFEDLNKDGANDNVTLFYALPEYVAYQPVEDAADGYKDLDLIAIKAKILYALANGMNTASYTDHMLTFVQSISAAKTAEEVEALVISHNAEMIKANTLGDVVSIVPTGYTASATYAVDLANISIYEFESLFEQMTTTVKIAGVDFTPIA